MPSRWVVAALAVVLAAGYYGDPTASSSRRPSSSSRGGRERKGPVLSFDLNKTIERSANAIKAQDYDRAAKLAGRAAAESPGSWQAWLQLGLAKRLGGGAAEVEVAAAAFERAAELNGELPEVHTHLAAALACTPNLHGARKAAFRSLALQPSSVSKREPPRALL